MVKKKKKSTFKQDPKTGGFESNGTKFTKEGKVVGDLGEKAKKDIKASGSKEAQRKFGLSGEQSYQINGKTYYGQEGKKQYEQEKRKGVVPQTVKTDIPKEQQSPLLAPGESGKEEEKEQGFLGDVSAAVHKPIAAVGSKIRDVGYDIAGTPQEERTFKDSEEFSQSGVGKFLGVGIAGTGAGLAATSAFISPAIKTALVGLSGTSGIMTWLASDNLLSGISIYMRDISNAVKFNGMDPNEAVSKMNEARQRAEQGKSFVESQTALNPVLWPFRNLVNLNVENTMISIDEHIAQVQAQTLEQPQDLNTK